MLMQLLMTTGSLYMPEPGVWMVFHPSPPTH